MRPFVIGVDEAGRAPLAGPVSVGVVRVPEGFDVAREFPGVKDSKKLSPDKREEIYRLLLKRQESGDVQFCVRFSDHLYIDSFGITRAVRRAVWSGVKFLAPDPALARVQLDGLLQAPCAYAQETIVHGDDLVPLISLASVVAKVRRDRLMRRLSRTYPEYYFELHKGYGTQTHWDAINMHGLCDIHRRTYCNVDAPPQ
ncbi:MAG: ribonuclease HII [Patescibacteria group bacterium]